MRLAPLLLFVLVAAGCNSGAPSASLQSLDDPGKSVELSSLKGKPVLLDFWATWCGPCLANMPHLQEIYDKYSPEGLQVLAITSEEREKVKAFKASAGYRFPIYLDVTQKASLSYGVQSIPHAVLISREGAVLYEGHPADPKFEEALKQAMAK